MFLFMLKKELTQFVRSKGKIIMLFLFPIILITVLGFALNNMMGGTSNLFKDGKVLYRIEASSKYKEGFASFRDAMAKEFKHLEFEEVSDVSSARALVLDNKAYSFITVSDNGFDYYRNSNYEDSNAKIFRGIFEGVVNKYKLSFVVIKNNPSLISSISNDISKDFVKHVSVGNRSISSIDYYTFAELALIILYVSINVGDSVVSEREQGTIDRIRLSCAKSISVVLSKVCFGILLVICQIVVVYVYSTFVLGAKWGDNVLFMMFNLLCLGVFASVLGATVGSVLKDGKAMNGILNTCIVGMCLLGGSYTPLALIKSIPVMSTLSNFSPVYWVNSALISLSTGVRDSYSPVAIGICLGGSVILIVIYLVNVMLKRRNGFV